MVLQLRYAEYRSVVPDFTSTWYGHCTHSSQKKKFLGKFTEASLDGTNPGDCKIRFKFHFEHLGEKKRLTKACDALLAAFEQQKDDFFAIHTHFAKIMFACEAIDLNTVTTYKPKKSKNSKQKKRVHSSTTPKKKNPP